MISSYILGDLVLLHLNDIEKQEILTQRPDSIGGIYILETRNNTLLNNIDIITKIVMENIETYAHFLPNDISESTLVHLRLGDFIAENERHEKLKRPLSIKHIKSLISNTNTNKTYVICKCVFAKTSSTNYDECIFLSYVYMQNVINALNATHFNSDNTDIDLYCSVKAKVFVQGRGYFSKLIVEIRKKLGLFTIVTV